MDLQDRLLRARLVEQDTTLGLYALWSGGQRVYLYDQAGQLLNERAVPTVAWTEQQEAVKAELKQLLIDALPF